MTTIAEWLSHRMDSVQWISCDCCAPFSEIASAFPMNAECLGPAKGHWAAGPGQQRSASEGRQLNQVQSVDSGQLHPSCLQPKLLAVDSPELEVECSVAKSPAALCRAGAERAQNLGDICLMWTANKGCSMVDWANTTQLERSSQRSQERNNKQDSNRYAEMEALHSAPSRTTQGVLVGFLSHRCRLASNREFTP